MRLYPESALVQLEFDKVRSLLIEQTRTALGNEKAENLRVHTRKHFIDLELRQSYEYLQLLAMGQTFQHDQVFNLSKELKLLSIQGAVLTGEIFIQFRNLAENIGSIFRWFDEERRDRYAAVFQVLSSPILKRRFPRRSTGS